jgi:hypothetical protein
VSEQSKNPVFVEAGLRGSAKRWGERRVVRLDRLDPATAAVIRAILRAQDNAANRKTAAVSDVPATASAEGHGSDASAAA